jgi:hypothetical protein
MCCVLGSLWKFGELFEDDSEVQLSVVLDGIEEANCTQVERLLSCIENIPESKQ